MSALSNRRDLMEYDCFSEMMEEMREIHKMIQKLTSQKCSKMSSFNSGTGKIDFFDCSSTDESKRDCTETSYY